MKNNFEAINQIKRDKHTLLEGYVSEFLFEQQFLKTRVLPYTHGWWLGHHNNTPFVFIIKNKLSELDYEIINKLSPHYNCYQVCNESGEWYFHNGSTKHNLAAFLKNLNITPKQQGLCATSSTANPIRQNRCINFFEDNNIIFNIAAERNFADDILTVYFSNILNIDYITQNEQGDLIAVEVKFKNESYNGCFGINAGEVNLFTKLRSLGFKVFHCILYKTRQNKDYSVFDYLDDKSIEHNWYVSEFNEKELDGPSTAPTKTSVDGKKLQTFYQLKKDKMLNSPYRYKLKYDY